MKLATIGVLLFVASLSVGWMMMQWGECLKMGHSRFYCVGHVLR